MPFDSTVAKTKCINHIAALLEAQLFQHRFSDMGVQTEFITFNTPLHHKYLPNLSRDAIEQIELLLKQFNESLSAMSIAQQYQQRSMMLFNKLKAIYIHHVVLTLKIQEEAQQFFVDKLNLDIINNVSLQRAIKNFKSQYEKLSSSVATIVHQVINLPSSNIEQLQSSRIQGLKSANIVKLKTIFGSDFGLTAVTRLPVCDGTDPEIVTLIPEIEVLGTSLLSANALHEARKVMRVRTIAAQPIIRNTSINDPQIIPEMLQLVQTFLNLEQMTHDATILKRLDDLRQRMAKNGRLAEKYIHLLYTIMMSNPTDPMILKALMLPLCEHKLNYRLSDFMNFPSRRKGSDAVRQSELTSPR